MLQEQRLYAIYQKYPDLVDLYTDLVSNSRKPEVIIKRKEYQKKYQQRPEVKAKQREYYQRLDVNAKRKEYQRKYYMRIKNEGPKTSVIPLFRSLKERALK